MKLARTLSPEALVDYRRELNRSLSRFGVITARKTQDRLLESFRGVAEGTALGHRHPVLDNLPMRFRCLTVAPLVIIYNADARVVLAIVDGRRDVASIMARRLGEP